MQARKFFFCVFNFYYNNSIVKKAILGSKNLKMKSKRNVKISMAKLFILQLIPILKGIFTLNLNVYREAKMPSKV